MHSTWISSPDLEIVTKRKLDFPRNQVYRAWTDPLLLQRWWGPKGFTNSFHHFDLREGGDWIFTMHGPDGKAYPNESRYVCILAQELLVWDHVSPPVFRIVVQFDDTGDGGTVVTFRMIFRSKGECDKIRTFAPEKNEENMDRLTSLLSNLFPTRHD
jgi:uncharacterized protein YndB with AHSA1/START domain